jgi:hypothetical protein
MPSGGLWRSTGTSYEAIIYEQLSPNREILKDAPLGKYMVWTDGEHHFEMFSTLPVEDMAKVARSLRVDR